MLDEYADYLPLTIRQVFYRLVATREYEKSEPAYKRLMEMLGRARRGGVVPFDAIRDDSGHQPHRPRRGRDSGLARSYASGELSQRLWHA